MSQERWDVKLQFLDGPLRFQDMPPARGPVVRLGANPGPGGVRLTGYRGVDDRQAVITVYDGANISIAPVGVNQVRVATHQNVDWEEFLPIQKPVQLAPGSVVHLGPANRGCTFLFVEARRLGDWEQRQIVTLDEQSQQLGGAGTIDATGGRPWWFIPSVLSIALLTTVGVVASQLDILRPAPPKLGPEVDGEVSYERISLEDVASIDLSSVDVKGLEQAFGVWVMGPNADQSKNERLLDAENWDQVFLQYFKLSVAAHAHAWNFWIRLESVEPKYREVVDLLQNAGLPTVFAGIPYIESKYRPDALSPVCAYGWWQFMPEVALRGGMKVSGCHFRDSAEVWSPKDLVPVKGVLKNAPYIRNNGETVTCRIRNCDVDDREKLVESTQAAIKLLSEAWNDRELKASGALVQMVILSHNSGYDDGQYAADKKTRPTNILPAYRRHLKSKKLDKDPRFYGDNITCRGAEYRDYMKANERCDGVLANETQHYAYTAIAQHTLAMCYYAKNHGNQDTWKPFVGLTVGDGYCSTLEIPTREAILKRTGNQSGGAQ